MIMNGNTNDKEVLYDVPRKHDSTRNQLLKQQQSYRTQSAENPCYKLDCTLLEDSGTHSRYASPSPTPSRASTLPSPLTKSRTMHSNSYECSPTLDLSYSSELPPPMALNKPREHLPPVAAPNSPRPLPRIPPSPVCPNYMGNDIYTPSAIMNQYSNPQVPRSDGDISVHPTPTRVPVPRPRQLPQPTTSRPEPEGRQNSIDQATLYLNVHAHDH